MKKLLITLSLFTLTLTGYCQTVLTGNIYTSTHTKAAKAKDVATGQFYKDSHGTLWPVYKTAAGKLYALRASLKTGKKYKFYIHTN